jgi:hypothetical protein
MLVVHFVSFGIDSIIVNGAVRVLRQRTIHLQFCVQLVTVPLKNNDRFNRTVWQIPNVCACAR